MKLQHSEERFRQIAENDQAWIWEVDAEGLYTFSSQAIENILGYKIDEIVGEKYFYDLFHPEDRDELKNVACEMFRQQQPFREFANRNVTKNGKIVWLSTSGVPILDNKGNLLGYSGADIDISARKLAQDELLKSKEEYKRIFENLQEVYCEVTMDGTILEISPSVEILSQYTREELIGKSLLDIYVNPIDREGFLKLALDTGKVNNYKVKLKDKDGSQYSCSITATLVRDTYDTPVKLIASLRDISESERIEEALRVQVSEFEISQKLLKESEGRFKALHDATFGGIVIHDKGVILDCNQGLSDMTGFTNEELIGMDGLKLIEPGSLDLVLSNIQIGYTEQYEVEGVRKDGSVYPLAIRGQNVNYKGREVRVIEFRDVSERKQAENDLLESRNKFEAIMNQTAEGITVADLAGSYTYVNPAFCKMMGYSEEELLRMTVFDMKAENQSSELFEKSKYSRESTPGQVILKRKDGTEFFSEIMGKAVEINNKEHVLGVIRDITERKLIEEERDRLLQAIDQSNDTIVITDTAGSIKYTNPAFTRITGYTNGDALGNNPRILKSGKQNDAFYKEMWRVLTNGKTWSGQLINKKKDGTLFTEGATISPVRNPSGEIVNYVAVKRDITDEIKMEEDLRQTHKMEAVGTMAGGIAHDFNNLLSIISGNIDIIQYKNNPGSHSEENIDHIKSATNRAKNLVAQILAFSRQEECELIPVDLSIAIDEALNLLRSTTPTTVEIMSSVNNKSVFINTDTTQFHQIIINLCTNAVHAMNEKGLLSILLEEVELPNKEMITIPERKAGRYAKLTISDTGTGMEKDILDRIFDLFFTTKGVGEGTGMGLSMIHGIVEQHGGFITVDSTPGLGTTFNVYFPVANEAGTESLINVAEALPTGTERILFVDDEECIALTSKELLECQGYKVTSVMNSIEALSVFEKNPEAFDLVFTDQTMPEMSGAELAVKLLQIRPDIPIVLCSGYSAKMSAAKAKGIGVFEFCMKPMNMAQLAKVARRVLDESGNPV